ncbi:hypothetical protein [Pseudomonas asplenii]|uniref:hypothetical protein n=1 Tax=Pseudomonas asplenii TaxID=53407 RepID=UPI0012F9915D|nr:hypothetical protein [Pseudomonas fuscovaginae]
MKTVLIVIFLIAGCTNRPTSPSSITFAPSGLAATSCIPTERLTRQLREALKSRAEWKRYAEILEKLPAAKAHHDPYP